MTRVPYSREAEQSVVGQLLSEPKNVPLVVGTLLQPGHFYVGAHRLLYEAIIEAHYADEPIDPLTMAEVCAKRLAKGWECSEDEAKQRVEQMSAGPFTGSAVDHARLVKREADYRRMLAIASKVQQGVENEALTPEEIAGITAQEAMKVATDALLTHDLVSFGDAGRSFVNDIRVAQAARAQGVELGAYFGIGAIDDFTRGFQPTELLIAGGAPGVGKSAVWWKAGQNFAERQMRKPEGQRIGTLILSLEMGQKPSNVRLAQALTGIDGSMLREGKVDQNDMAKITGEWGRRRDLPLWFNYSSMMRASQVRALISEAIRKHNVGLVIIDHFRYFSLDRRPENPYIEDEEKAKFLKQRIAKDLNVAVVCLAHTSKAASSRDDRRPRLHDLRGSGQIGAEADFVAMMYRPWLDMTDDEHNAPQPRYSPTDAEMIWVKNRHGLDGTGHFYFNPAKMEVL